MPEIVWTKEYKIDRYRKLNKDCKPGQIVFAGSSLMEMFPIEKFVAEEQLGIENKLGITVYNRGIGGFVTQELIDNIDTCILDLQPSRLFINIGTSSPRIMGLVRLSNLLTGFSLVTATVLALPSE